MVYPTFIPKIAPQFFFLIIHQSIFGGKPWDSPIHSSSSLLLQSWPEVIADVRPSILHDRQSLNPNIQWTPQSPSARIE